MDLVEQQEERYFPDEYISTCKGGKFFGQVMGYFNQPVPIALASGEQVYIVANAVEPIRTEPNELVRFRFSVHPDGNRSVRLDSIFAPVGREPMSYFIFRSSLSMAANMDSLAANLKKFVADTRMV